jgi:hypothetical protein
MPHASSSRRRIESSLSEICGIAWLISENRIGPPSSECTIAPVQRLPSSSTASWKYGHTPVATAAAACWGSCSVPLEAWTSADAVDAVPATG